MRLLVFSPDPNDTNSFYRAIGPYSMLERQKKDFQIQVSSECSWSTLSRTDAVLFQRPFDPQHVAVLQHCKKSGVPIIVDYDDLLHNLPPYNPYHDLYAQQEVQIALQDLAKLADVMTVSTPYLRDCFPEHKDKILVIPNAWDDRVYPTNQVEKTKNKEIRILWRGSPTHQGDLDLFAEPCVRLHKKYPSIKWIFLGDRPYFLRQMNQNSVFSTKQAVDITFFPMHMASFSPDIVVFPLLDNPFNRSRSNNGWLESSYCNAITIAPDFEEWRRPGIVNYSAGNLGATLEAAIENIEAMRSFPAESWDFISKHLFLSNINTLRHSLMRQIDCRIKKLPQFT